jgi:acetyl-CoA carboxylase carboxyltransferase component
MQEGIAALGGYARVFRRTVALSGRVPQISVVSGVSAGGGAYSPALTDFVVMTEESSMFLTGPGVVREALGEDVDAERLGGTRVHQRNGVCHFIAEDDFDSTRLARELLGYLPSHSGASAPRAIPQPAPGHDPSASVPEQARRVYDVRDVIGALVDQGEILEVASGWARNLVTAMARVDGRPVGVIANQPRYLGGVLDAASSEKGARFVNKCNSFGIPLLVLVDTPGFMPGMRQEGAGVIRHGATLVHAFAQASVPRVTLILRKAFGGAFITMNSKDLGADYVFAWPGAEIGVMGATPAVGVIHRRELAAAADPDAERAQLARQYADAQLRPQVAAETGHVDELIEPRETRARLVWALQSLCGGWGTP